MIIDCPDCEGFGQLWYGYDQQYHNCPKCLGECILDIPNYASEEEE